MNPSSEGYISGRTFRDKLVKFEIINDLAIFEGDIVLGSVNDLKGSKTERGILKSVIVSGDNLRWPRREIPFQIDVNIPNPVRVNNAIAHWENNTPIRFVPRTRQHQNFVTFTRIAGDRSFSNIGMLGGEQLIKVSDGATFPIIIHEIGHTVGLWHEQSRGDRDDFISVVWSNVDPAKDTGDDLGQHITDGDDVGNYDYCSIMHYPPNALSLDSRQPTIVPIRDDLPCFANLGSATGLSRGDVEAVIKFYGGWDLGTFINTTSSGPGSIIQSDFKSPDPQRVIHGNFEVVVQEGSNLLHYWHDNTTRKWSRAATISNAANWSWLYHTKRF